MVFPVKRRALRVAVVAALACFAQAGARAAPDAPYVPVDGYPPAGSAAARGPVPAHVRSGGGLGVLAPALPMPIQLGDSVDLTAELPPCQPVAASSTEAAGEQAAEPGIHAVPSTDPIAADHYLGLRRSSGETSQETVPAPAAGTGPNDMPMDCAVVPVGDPTADILPLSLDYIPPPPGTGAPVKWGRPVGAPKPWFSGVSTQQGMVLGDRNLTYRSADGPSVSVGSLTPFSPGWSSTAPIGGLQVSNLTSGSGAPVPEGKLGYSSVWGHINNTDPSETAGGVEYGATAGSSSLRYGLTPEMTLEGQVQSARALTTTGLGTTYSMGQWGTLQGGATQSHFDTAAGWRYSLGYNVSLLDSLKLGYSNELTSSGYGDLSTYEDGTTSGRQLRSTFSAGVPLGGWGEVSGTYSGLRDTSGELLEQRYGISQSMMLSPNVRLAVGADHDVISGDYGINMQLTVPIGGR